MYTANISHSRWCGARRYEVSLRIYEVLRNKGLSCGILGVQIGLSRQCVSQTINGTAHNKKVLEVLRGHDVPEKYLFDPRRITNEQVKIKAVA